MIPKCANCKYWYFTGEAYADDLLHVIGDFRCVNKDSENYNVYTLYDSTCDFFKRNGGLKL